MEIKACIVPFQTAKRQQTMLGTQEATDALVDEAHTLGLNVAAHAHETEGILTALHPDLLQTSSRSTAIPCRTSAR